MFDFNSFQHLLQFEIKRSEAEFKEIEPRFKYGWFHLKLYLMFQNLSRYLSEADLRRGSNSLNSDSGSFSNLK